MAQRKPKRTGWSQIKIQLETRQVCDLLLAKASADGWASLGVDRNDPASLGAVVDAGLRALADAASIPIPPRTPTNGGRR